VSQFYFHALAKKVAQTYGVATANFFLVFTAIQFHIPFYLSRTLPNFLALPIVILGFSLLVSTDSPTTHFNSPTRRLQYGIGLLLSSGIIARSEVAVLCGTIIFVDLILSPSPKQYLYAVIPAVLISGAVSTAATVIVDSYLWNAPSFPEIEALLFNVVSGHASAWGVEPWHYYLVSVAKLLNPITAILIAPTIVITRYTSISTFDTLRKLRYILLAPTLYVFGFSFLPHKEWRFIIYIIPLLTTTAAISAAYIHNHRAKSLLYRLLHTIIILSIPSSLLVSITMSFISATNYPGGLALESLHSMSNATNARVYLDVPTRMTGATLPLCTHPGWSYTKSENAMVLDSIEYWQDIDFALVGSLGERPCNHGRGVEGKGEWDVVYRQKGYAGVQWRSIDLLPMERARVLGQKMGIHVDKIVERIGGVKVPWIKLEDKNFVLRHLRVPDFEERSSRFEEVKEKERAGLGKLGEVEGQWRDFY
jgi:alpha-1,6-mannosyltransferase